MARPRQASTQRDATSTERIAGISFFLFVLMQVPSFMTETTATAEGYSLLSPLQVVAAHVANTGVGGSYRYAQAALMPGAWTRDAFSPWARCMYKSNMRGPCKVEAQRLTNYNYVAAQTQLPALQKFVRGPDMKASPPAAPAPPRQRMHLDARARAPTPRARLPRARRTLVGSPGCSVDRRRPSTPVLAGEGLRRGAVCCRRGAAPAWPVAGC